MTKSQIIKELQKRCDEYIKAFISLSESTGDTPSQSTAITLITNEMNQWIPELIENEDLTALAIADIKNTMKAYSTQKMSLSYTQSMNRNPRKVNGQQPVVSPDNNPEEDVAEPIDKGKNFMKTSLEDRIKSGVEFGDFPNKKQVDIFLDETIELSIRYYATDLSEKSQDYIRGQLKIYKSNLIKTVYEPQAKIITSSKESASTADSSGQTQAANSNVSPKVYADKIPVAAGVSEWAKTNISFSGCDMVVSAEMKTTNGERVSVIIGSMQTLSYSIYRQLSAVKNIGNINAKDYVGGPRTIAGSMVFTVLNQHWGAELLTKFSEAEGYKHSKKLLMDEVAPLNLTVSMANEYGVYSRLAIYGVRFFSEGQVMSINDIYTENTFQYVALNMDYLVDINSNVSTDKSSDRGTGTPPPVAVSTQPPNDGGKRVDPHINDEEEKTETEVKPSVTEYTDKVVGPDGKIIDLTKYKSKSSAVAYLNGVKIKADSQVFVRDFFGDEKGVRIKHEIEDRYREALKVIDEYYKNKDANK